MEMQPETIEDYDDDEMDDEEWACHYCGGGGWDIVGTDWEAKMHELPNEALSDNMLMAFAAILKERRRQDAKWGVQDHIPIEWVPILVEEVGEVCKAVNECWWTPDNIRSDWANYEKELIEVAAVAVAAIECLHRKGNLALVHERDMEKEKQFADSLLRMME